MTTLGTIRQKYLKATRLIPPSRFVRTGEYSKFWKKQEKTELYQKIERETVRI